MFICIYGLSDHTKKNTTYPLNNYISSYVFVWCFTYGDMGHGVLQVSIVEWIVL